MYCRNCGKEIPDQARFCNYCGNQVSSSQPQASNGAQPAKKSAPKKKGSVGKTLLSIVIAVIVYFVAQFVAEKLIAMDYNSTQSSGSDAPVIAVASPSLTESCIYGALYQDGYLTYGLARLNMPGYTLVPGEGDAGDWLISADNTSLFSANKSIEIGISYDASDADGILQSYSGNPNLTNISMVDFRKYEVGGYPVIRYIISCTVDGLDEYMGEIIVCPNANPTETLRLSMETLAVNGSGAIDQVFDSLDISSAYALSMEDTQTMGLNRITVK